MSMIKLSNNAPTSLGGLALALAVLVFSLPTERPDATVAKQSALLIQHVRLVNKDGALTEPMSILMQDGLIKRINTSIDVADANVIDGTGLTALPGLIDSHTHTYGSALTDNLRFGVTTVLDMFTDHRSLDASRQARTRLTATEKADLFSAGMLATAKGGHGTQFGIPIETLSTPTEAHAWVASRKAEGSDYIKLVYMPGITSLPSIDRETARALIRAGHAEGMQVVAHISTHSAAAAMVEDGIDGLVHVFADQVVSDELLEQVKAKGVFIIPTLAVIAAIDRDNEIAGLDAETSGLLSPMQEQTLGSSFGMSLKGFSLPIALKNVERFFGDSVPILAGSDAPNPGTAHGISLHHELQLLVRAGLTPGEALQAASTTPAKLFKLEGRGAIEEGARADLVLAEGDPTQDISAALNIKHIFKNGASVSREVATSDTFSEVSEGFLSDFETELSSSEYFEWSGSTDKLAGGNSEATLERVEGGAQESGYAMKIDASVNSGFAFPWAGASIALPQNGLAAPVDVSKYRSISFDIKGTPGTLRVMAFSAGAAGIPPTQTVEVTEGWQALTLNLSRFSGLQTNQFTGFAFVAGPAMGRSTIYLDNVTLAQ